MILRIAIVVVVGVALFGVVTLVALEGREVVVLRTLDERGQVRETRTWIADDGGHSWVEAANPERPFYQQILRQPEIEVVRGGEVQRVHAAPLPPEQGHALIRNLLAEKYGWADCWIGLIADTSRSTAVRLDPR